MERLNPIHSLIHCACHRAFCGSGIARIGVPDCAISVCCCRRGNRYGSAYLVQMIWFWLLAI